ncbi:hypothetical protein OG523_01240 [Streptomyces virginiae]|uniref:hypothetical protein n=1 Tax=Streptomyces virginiae TaxID=1961 RepID=UPI002E2EA5E8|nr:hypothetical protein [Streptomyces virginiae]
MLGPSPGEAPQGLEADPTSGTTGPRRFEATIYTPDDRDFTSITLRPQDGRGSLTATDHHPFWSETRKQWTDAADLNTGDTLRTGAPLSRAPGMSWLPPGPPAAVAVSQSAAGGGGVVFQASARKSAS